MVRRWNRLKGNSLVGRRVVYVHLPITPNLREPHVVAAKSGTPSGSKNKKDVQRVPTNNNGVLRHRVKQGETLYSIASSYKTTVAALKRDNGVATLRPGMVLVIKDVR